jgi:hypothetical protein
LVGGEKRLTGTVSLDVAKTFDTVWVDGLAYKLMALNFPSDLVETIQSYLRRRMFEASVGMMSYATQQANHSFRLVGP